MASTALPQHTPGATSDHHLDPPRCWPIRWRHLCSVPGLRDAPTSDPRCHGDRSQAPPPPPTHPKASEQIARLFLAFGCVGCSSQHDRRQRAKRVGAPALPWTATCRKHQAPRREIRVKPRSPPSPKRCLLRSRGGNAGARGCSAAAQVAPCPRGPTKPRAPGAFHSRTSTARDICPFSSTGPPASSSTAGTCAMQPPPRSTQQATGTWKHGYSPPRLGLSTHQRSHRNPTCCTPHHGLVPIGLVPTGLVPSRE